MAITLRSAKGSELTHAELDANFTTLLDADLDSAAILAMIDSDYVQARQLNFDQLLDSSEVIQLIDSDYIALRRPADTTFSLSGDGSNYIFTGDGFPSAATDPTLYLTRGKTYDFTNVPSEHPLEIRIGDGDSAYNSGVTNNAGTGTIRFTVPMNAPTSLVYQCQVHAGMIGNIKILDDTDNQRDSAFVTGIIDSDYIQARQADIYRDSAFVTTIVDSDYVQLRETAQDFAYSSLTGAPTILDSANVNSLISTATLGYSTDSADLWNGTPPTTVDSALDRLALVVRTLNGGTGA